MSSTVLNDECLETVSMYKYSTLKLSVCTCILAAQILGIYRACKYESMHSTQVLDIYLDIQVLGAYMPGIYIELSLTVCTVSIKL